MLLQVSVCPQCGSTESGTPLGPGTPSPPPDQANPPRPGTPPQTRYTLQDQVHSPGPGTPPDQVPPPQQTATVADGTHPTGMHSCLTILLQKLLHTLNRIVRAFSKDFGISRVSSRILSMFV